MLETQLFDLKEEICGSNLRVARIKFSREEKKFDGVQSLKDQIRKDISQSRLILARKQTEEYI